MPFAVIRTGGKQYIVSPGMKLKIEKLPAEAGKTVTFDDVLLVSDDKTVSVGQPKVVGVSVTAKVLVQGKHDKQIIFKMRPKKRYRVKTGHRQPYTEVEIEKIVKK